MNVESNKGRRLRPALSRFSAMLIEEARDLTGLTFEQLDEEFDFEIGQSRRYSLYPWQKKNRGPQAGGTQALENRVAKLLKRSAHNIVVTNSAKINLENIHLSEEVEGKIGAGLNLRDFEAVHFQLNYEGDWPTYRRLKSHRPWLHPGPSINKLLTTDAHEKWPEMLRLYSWQWGVLWDQGLPWLSREALGIDPNVPIESFLPELTAKAMRERMLLPILAKISRGRELLSIWEDALLSGCNDSTLDLIFERVTSAAKTTENHIKRHGPEILIDLQSDINDDNDQPPEPDNGPSDEYSPSFESKYFPDLENKSQAAS